MNVIFHVRHRLRPVGVNNGGAIRRLLERPTSTFCGAACTAYDAPWADRKRVRLWTTPSATGEHPAGTTFEPCPACMAEIAKEASHR